MTLAIPNLSQAFSSLAGGLSSGLSIGGSSISTPSGAAPFKLPTVPSLSSPQVGVSSLSALAAPKTPAVPSLSTPVAPAASGVGGMNYQIQQGDTLGAIAAKYGTTTSALMAANPTITDANLIRAGSALSIPGSKPPVPALPNLSTPSPANSSIMPPKPAVTPAANVTTPSGLTVNPNTGSVVGGSGAGTTPPVPDTSGLGFTGIGTTTGASGATTPTDTTGAAAGAGTGTPAVPSITDLIQQYLGTLQPGSDELTALTNLNNLNASTQVATTNAQNQPIALPFITGQQAALQRENATLATPLQNQASLLEAQRQMKQQGLQTLLGMTQPVATSYGGTLSRLDPSTGQYSTIVNPFGTADSTTGAAGAPTTTDVIGQAIANGQLSSDQVTRYGIPFIAATLAADPGYNFITQKASTSANSSSLTTQQGYVDTVTRAFNTANENLASLTDYMTQSGAINTSSIPLINTITNQAKAGALDPGAVAGFNAAIAGLRAEYAQVLSRGGEVTDSSRNAAASLIPDNISPAQLQQVATRLNTEGQNAIAAATQQVQTIQTRIAGNPGGSGTGAFSSTAGGGSTGNIGDSWDTLLGT